VTNEGFCSWNEFAKAIFRLAGKKVDVLPIKTADYSYAAVRPLNSRLSKKCLDDNGFARLPSWEDALTRYLSMR
jgi:dTDP-4-dehydrorhamnose reductase